MTTILAGAALISTFCTLISLFVLLKGQMKLNKKVGVVHGVANEALAELVTLNGKTVGELGDLTEGRRIIRDVPIAEQSPSERHYVEAVHVDDEKNKV